MNDLLRKVPLFSRLTDEQLDLVMKCARWENVKAHTVLFQENDPGNTFIVIMRGSIKIYIKNKTTHEEKILSILREGHSFGELSLIDGLNRSASAQTLENSVLLTIARSDFMKLLEQNFHITQSILIELSKRLRETNQQVSDLTFLDPRSRIIKNLIQLASRLGNRDNNIIYSKMPLNYDELAKMAGVTKNELLTVLRELEDRQILRINMNDFVLNLSKARN